MLNQLYFEKYLSREGDRWDLLAYEFYGDCALMVILIADNPHIPSSPELPAGKVIYIREEAPLQTNNLNTTNLPPWRQQ